jgi:hypothetical protein
MATFYCAQHDRTFTRQTHGQSPWCPDCLDEAQEGQSFKDSINDTLRGFAELNVLLARERREE